MKITDETIKYVAALAKLELPPEESSGVKKDLESILNYMETMNELDTSNAQPMSHAIPLINVFRDDVVLNGDDRENVLANAPVSKDGCFVVPKTVE